MKLLTPDGQPTKLQAGDRVCYDVDGGRLNIQRGGRYLKWLVGGRKEEELSISTRNYPVYLVTVIAMVECLAATHGLEAEGWATSSIYQTCVLRAS